MTRRLLILRHAKSDRDGDVARDFDRPLAKRGRKDAPRVGAWLSSQGLIPDHVFSSPAERAKETVHAVVDELGLERRSVHFDKRLYLAGPETLLEVIAASPPDAKTVLVVGHNPGMDELLEALAALPPGRTEGGKLLTTAALAWLETDDDWRSLQPGASRLIELWRPR